MSEEFRRRFKVWKKWSKRNTNSWLHKILVLFGVVHSPTFGLAMSMERCRENIRAAEATMKGLTLGIKFGEDAKVLDKEKDEKLIKRGTRAEMSMIDESSGSVTDGEKIIDCINEIGNPNPITIEELKLGSVTDGKKTIGDLGQDIIDSFGVPANAMGGKLPGTVTDDLDDEELDGVVDNFCGTVTDDLDKWAKGTPLEVQDDE